MPHSTQVRIIEAQATCHQIAYRAPIKFGGRVVTDATLLNVRVELERPDGRRATGFGSMPMGNVWAWPTQTLSNDQTLAAMLHLGQAFVMLAPQIAEPGHPLEIATDWSDARRELADEVTQRTTAGEPMPILAQLVATSPLEGALFDAYGRLFERNAYDLLSREFLPRDLSHWLGPAFTGLYLDQFTRRTPQPRMPLYHLVGALDPLTSADQAAPIRDGLPETLAEWIERDQLTHLKIKLNGDDLNWDVERVVTIERIAQAAQQARGCDTWFYSLDFNERCQDVEYVLDFLAQVEERSPHAFNRVQYIEQPTHRDLHTHRHLRMHRAAARKPVVIDESLVDLESLHLSRELGYSGVALKACKGHAEALLMGAAAQHDHLFLCVQDLTCPGASFLHSASLAARIPTVAAIEGNGRQYCPAGNQGWADRYPTMFRVVDGTIETGVLTEVGLGFDTTPMASAPPSSSPQ